MRIDVSKEDRNAIDSARDALHRVVFESYAGAWFALAIAIILTCLAR